MGKKDNKYKHVQTPEIFYQEYFPGRVTAVYGCIANAVFRFGSRKCYVSQQTIADIVGCTRGRVGKDQKGLQWLGLIEFNGYTDKGAIIYSLPFPRMSDDIFHRIVTHLKKKGGIDGWDKFTESIKGDVQRNEKEQVKKWSESKKKHNSSIQSITGPPKKDDLSI